MAATNTRGSRCHSATIQGQTPNRALFGVGMNKLVAFEVVNSKAKDNLKITVGDPDCEGLTR